MIKMSIRPENAFMVGMYSFIPLNGIKRKYWREFKELKSQKPSNLIRFTKAQYTRIELVEDYSLSDSDKEGEWKKVKLGNVKIPEFYFGYKYNQTKYKRFVTLRFWLVNFRSLLNKEGRYYLVVSTCINKAFIHEPATSPLNDNDICTLQDVVRLKQAFYGDKRNEYSNESKLHYLDENGNRISILAKLDEIIKEITGKDSKGKYGRYYAADVWGVNINPIIDFDSFKSLEEAFSKEYYSKETKSYDEVVADYDKLVYGLIYGNENCDVLPSDRVEGIVKGGFSNNKSERLFAGHKTMVYLHTHNPFQWEKENEGWIKSIDAHIDSISGDFLIYDICLVMEAKFKLKSIQKNLSDKHPSSIKDALAAMSGYLSMNPYHLGEYGKKVKYIYQAMGVTDLFDTVMTQGNLLAGAKEIELNKHLSHRVYNLTGITVGIGVLQLLISIICCNNSNNSETMCDCLFSGSGSQSVCGVVIGCLLFLALAACAIVMTVYQVKSFNELKSIKGELKKLDK